MFRLVILAACLTLCKSHAVVPVVPVAHSIHGAVVPPYPLHHGYSGLEEGHGVIGGNLGYGHGLVSGYGVGHGLGHGPVNEGVGHGIGHVLVSVDSVGHGIGHGLLSGHSVGHGLGHGAGHAHGVAHHILKRSPHYVAPLVHESPIVAVGHVAPVHVEPVALSHQHRVDFHSSHGVPVVPVKTIVAPYLHGAPLLHKAFATNYGAGHYAGVLPHGHFQA